ncbi:MAG: clan AA aspartic protease, partial [Phaeodactylibacter sp.]|nr:clan AA aspartic protease [Phaeodactylibacter sp.]
MNQFSSKIILFVTLIALASCSTVKTIKLMKSGEVAQEDFFQEIPFEYRLGLVIIEVTIAGDNYNFLVDTGAPNLVSKELAEKLGLANVSEQKVGDSQGKKASLGFVQIDEVRIGNLSFRQTGAAVADLNQSQEIGCMEIDGFIGANLMRKAIWKIDYEHQIITITDKAEQLNIPDNALRIPFYTVMTGSPIVDVSLNKQVKANGTILDMGSSGDITLPRKNLDKLKKQMTN